MVAAEKITLTDIAGDDCEWSLLFHQSTVKQNRNDHNLMHDFQDEIPGYLHNNRIVMELQKISLKPGKQHIADNLITCYQKLIDLNFLEAAEMSLLKAWIEDLQNYIFPRY